MNTLYGKLDPRDIPIYSIGDVAGYLRIPTATIRSWIFGRRYPSKTQGQKFFRPLILIKNSKPQLLSFTNLIEIHVLRAIRQDHNIQLDKVRTALDYIDEQFQISHPLAREQFRTDGVDLFIEHYGSLINVSDREKTQLRNSFYKHLERIEPDDKGLAIKLYPFTRSQENNNPRLVVIDPRISFGRSVMAGTGIATSIVAERYYAGDSIEDLALDYRCSPELIQEAIRCERKVA